MLYLSQLLGTTVETPREIRVGRIVDVLLPVRQVGSDEPAYPDALLLEGEEEQHWRVPHNALSWFEGALQLTPPLEQLPQVTQSLDGEQQDTVSLAKEVLDQQVIDIKHKKAVRVNDVCFDS